ncbi:efflux transporter outer membrane subunit [Burkholderia plantarii]|uniref:efflux transporter outer membrane subunit n=1 Tax=Burkholderia plantarii TaxID=41899 RepID=UPI00070633A8|nr:efflux transporter outer membrane subunit [Burkholderia plantarii]ALK32841.1 NodT family RND efflux system outer membrane lipoprotein [Burkholderia plantarii]
MSRFTTPALLIVSLAVAACGTLTRTAWTPPAVTIPQHWQAVSAAAGPTASSMMVGTPGTRSDASGSSTPSPAKAEATSSADTDIDPWWQAFGDPELDRLVARALAGNHDLKTAVANLRAAQFAVDLARANRLPTINASAGQSDSHSLHGAHVVSHANSLLASASYVVDLWGALASSVDAARWEERATEQDERTARMTVASLVADEYWLLALLTEQIEQSDASIQYNEKTLALTNIRYRSGAVTAVDLLAARQSLASLRASRYALLVQQTQAENALAILLGQPPGEVFVVPSARLMTPLPAVDPGVPASVLARRPDVRSAELRTRATLATVDATRASFYPNLTLTGSAGTSSDALRNVLQNPIGTIAANVAAPFLNVWTMKAQVGSARTAYDAASVAFAKAFYQALADVENALAARADYEVETTQWADALDAARQSEQRIGWQYRAGSIPLQNWLDAQQATRNADAELASVRYALLVNQVALYVALGGR